MTVGRRAGSAAIAVAIGAAGLVGCGADRPATSQTVAVRHSSYAPSLLTVPVGRAVTLLIRNDDPIDHEWIVGDEATHTRHRTGTEPAHGVQPTEVSVPALSEKSTTITFDTPGDYRFVCHLPGHEAYGMTGVIRVV